MRTQLPPIKSANSLLDRTPPAELIEEWTADLASPKNFSEAEDLMAVIVFRCNQQWSALSAHIFDCVCTPRPIRTVPLRTGDAFRGLVNIDGELSLCVSLPTILGIADEGEYQTGLLTTRRLCLIRCERERVAFEVDELLGHRSIPRNSFTSVPENLAGNSNSYTESYCTLEGKLIALLNINKLSASLRGALSW